MDDQHGMRKFLERTAEEKSGLKRSTQEFAKQRLLASLYTFTKNEAIKKSNSTLTYYFLTIPASHLCSSGSTIVWLYHDSIALATMTVFPDHAWRPWKFTRSPRGWWSDLASAFKHGDPLVTPVVRLVFDLVLAPNYKVAIPQEWITKPIYMWGNSSDYHLVRFGPLSRVLREIYPEIDWDQVKSHSKGTIR